jgi:hypothetical protein
MLRITCSFVQRHAISKGKINRFLVRPLRNTGRMVEASNINWCLVIKKILLRGYMHLFSSSSL